jgi:hypothetical protein
MHRRTATQGTVGVIVSLIKANVLDHVQADAIKADWETSHEFRLKLSSFAEIV